MSAIVCLDLDLKTKGEDIEDVLNGVGCVLESLIEMQRERGAEDESAQEQARIFGMMYLAQTVNAMVEAGHRIVIKDRIESELEQAA